MNPFNKTAVTNSEIPENSMFGKAVYDDVDERGVCLFVVWCIEAIQNTGEGLRTDGLYRASGSKLLVDKIVGMNKEMMCDTLTSEKNVHVLAGALKKFLGCLKEPLLVIDNFKINIENENENKQMKIIKYTQTLDNDILAEECYTLKFVLEHLLRVAECHQENNMDINNLASIFGPILVRSIDKRLTDTDQQIQVTQFILANYSEIFENVSKKEIKMFKKSTNFSVAGVGQEAITGHFKKIQESDDIVNVTPRRVSEAVEVFETRKVSGKSSLSSMFGGCLKDAVDEETGVSQFVVWCVDAVETTGDNLKTDALYRASGNQAKVQEIATTAVVNMQEKLKKEVNVNVLTGALKLFFRQLKEPLLDYNEFQYLSQKSENDLEDACRETKKVIESLGDVEQKTLKYIMKHLIEVLKHTASNNMSVEGMGVVFGPTLMRLSYDTVNMAGDMRQQNRVVEFFLNNYDNIFTS